MQRLIVGLFLISPIIGLSQKGSPVIFEVYASAETTPVESPEDGADDPCIWVPFNAPAQTIVVGTDKKFGLETYGLDGKRIDRFGFGNINNVDINSEFFKTDDDPEISAALVIGTNRTTHSIDFFKLTINGNLALIHREVLGSNMGDLYGLCAYTNSQGSFFVASDKEGRIFQSAYAAGKQGIVLGEERSFRLPSTVEGLVADSYHDVLYVAEEDEGIWSFPLSINSDPNPRLILSTDPELIVSDIEGLTLYQKGQGKGYLLCSIQGANRYGVLDRESHELLGVFNIVDNNGIDGAQETDGIDVSSIPVPGYPDGFFVVQDGLNDRQKQNFKFVNWSIIMSKL
jgi:3-phytase